ncbi:MAG: beta-ketoacyl-ACP synthase III [Candidatus Nanopelagicales bacterium]|jgi:3-oxoacyl-[acyl-carrier-protein] synthase III
MSEPVTLASPTGAQYSRILSVGSYRPSNIVTNAEICTRIDSSDEWIRERSGITERRHASDDDTVVTMATAAANMAIARAGIDPSDVDMVILATISHPYPTPSAAVEVGELIGARGAAAMDISAACAGFCYGVALANDMIRGGSAKYVVVVGVEKLTDVVNPTDRGTAFLFADGAGAVVIGPSDQPGIAPVVWGGDGSQLQAINMTASSVAFRDDPSLGYPTVTMAGQQVFRWAVTEMAKATKDALEAAGITAEQLDVFIPHQANNRITDALVRALALPESVVVARDIVTMGNTSAASIPLAMDRMLETGEAKSGDTALLIGFGAGLVYAAQVVKLP